MAENLAQSVDGNLNRQSRALLEALHAAAGKFSMFGHQNETSNVITPDTDSDVHAVTGAYPAVWGNDSGAAGTGAYGTPLAGIAVCARFQRFRAQQLHTHGRFAATYVHEVSTCARCKHAFAGGFFQSLEESGRF